METYESHASGEIKVANISIGHFSRGLYRSTAAAFKEIVSNAYDADATRIRIDTNFPEFDFISCVDNGSGMPLDDFMRFFSHEGIGSSIKRKFKTDYSKIYNRPIIGRLGVGMLAIGQLCHSFKIESHYKDDENGKRKAYSAEIILEDIDSIPDIEEELRNTEKEKKKLKVGNWEYELIDYDETKQGFRIYSTDIRPTFRNEMRESMVVFKITNETLAKLKSQSVPNDILKNLGNIKNREIKGSENFLELLKAKIGNEQTTRFKSLIFKNAESLDKKFSFSFKDLHTRFFQKSRSIKESMPYFETLWELSILCPLPYYGEIDQYPFNLKKFKFPHDKIEESNQAIQFVKDHQNQLLNYNFHVFFDGVELRRCFQFPTEKDVTPKLYFIEFDNQIFGSRLKFAGYLFAQVSRAIRPRELNGIQIRLRSVGIGGYDDTFLRFYDTIETIRNRWVSGEIFVDLGLESALNIDRDSFNEHDEHYKKLQSFLHTKLRNIFNEINSLSKKESEKKRENKEQDIKNNLGKIVREQSQGKFRVLQEALGREAPMVSVNQDSGEIILNTSSRSLRKTRANEIMKSVMLAYHTARQITTTEDAREKKFYDLVKEILDTLV